MPGHKLSRGIPHELAQDVLQLDVTEIEGTDNLHYPEGIIKQAEELAAKAFGADKTFFLVNGSTCGIQAAIMSVCARGQKIIIGRDSHKSVISGLILSGAKPVFVYPQYNCEFGITEAISAKSIEQALCKNPDVVAVLITRPNYYGICSDIEEISNIVHSHNKLLIVDEAHGAHFAFSQQLPTSALQHGADICIQSAHKTLPAVTQGAYLHIRGSRVDLKRLQFNLNLLQTSSPSYIIMSYLDIAREIMVTKGAERLDTLINDIEWFKQGIKDCNTYKVLSNQYLNEKVIHDPTRLVINISKLGISGYAAEKILREKFKTQVEMADYENLVFITTIADNHETFSSLLEAMKGLAGMNLKNNQEHSNKQLHNIPRNQYSELDICNHKTAKSDNYNYHNENISSTKVFPYENLQDKQQSDSNTGENEKLSECNNYQRDISSGASIFPYEAYAAQKEEVSLKESCGRICSEIVTPYPPGIPILYPGEIIQKHQIQHITAIIQAGGKVNGMRNSKYIQVVE
ncbi:MAG: aminotransferase class I/II-fold pyridoxal phosphate-dependent enzyme [Ruminiclostridium sp.]